MATLQSFREVFLRYYQWLDTGDSDARDAWAAALPLYRDAVAAHEKRWNDNLDLPPYNFFAADVAIAQAERAPLVRWAAWALLVLSLGSLLLVRPLRTGALMPWRVRDVVPHPRRIDRILVVAIPLVTVIGSRLALSSGLSVWYVVATLGSLGLMAAAVRAVLWWLRPGADPFWLWACLGGALLVRTAWVSFAMRTTGPGGYWFRFWTDESARTAYVTVAFAAFCWCFVAVAMALRSAYDVRRIHALGAILAAVALPLLGLGLLLHLVGLETAITALNDQLAVVPLGLSRILGVTVHLGIPQALASWLIIAGSVVAVAMAFLVATGRRTTRPA